MTVFDGLSEAIRRLMATRQPAVTQVELSRRLGVGATTVSKFLRSDWNPELATLDRILSALGCDAHDLANALDAVNSTGEYNRVSSGAPDEVAEASDQSELSREELLVIVRRLVKERRD